MELEKQEGSRGEKRESGQAEELIELEGEEAAEMDRETALELDEKTADIIKLQFSDLCGRLKSVEIPGRAEPGWERLEAVEAEAVTGETEERPELGEGRKRGYVASHELGDGNGRCGPGYLPGDRPGGKSHVERFQRGAEKGTSPPGEKRAHLSVCLWLRVFPVSHR